MAEPLGSALLAAYGLAGQFLTPLVPVLLDRRARRGLEDPARRNERFGIAAQPRPDRSVVWVHAASVGETNAVMPLIRKLAEAGWFVVLTTVTVTGAKTAGRSLPEGVLHQFAPIDIRPWVGRFLDHWRPGLALFVESEVWPVTTDQLSRRAIPHVVVNGHMSERSFGRWRMLGKASRRIFGRIALVLAQTEEDADRLRRLGAPSVTTVGNLKFDVPPPPADDAALAALRSAIGERPLFLAASTHPGEDEIVVDAHAGLAQRYPGLVTVIVPRHPDRGPAIASMIAERGISVARRAAGEPMPPSGGIYVADTLGELGLFYRLAEVALVGGSLVPQGGHNPVEPALLGTAILTGPGTHNFAVIFDALRAAAGSIVVGDAAELETAVAHLFGDPAARRGQVAAAKAVMADFTGALDRTLDALRPFLADGQKRLA